MIRNVLPILTLLFCVLTLKSQDAKINKTYFKNGIFKVEANQKYGLVTFEDSVLIPIQYSFLSAINDTLIKAENEKEKVGLISINNDTIFPLELDKLNLFSNGLAVAYKNGKFGMINDTGAVIIPFEYSYLSKYYDDLIAFRKSSTCGVMDINQNIVIPEGKFNFIYEFRDGFAIASSKDNLKYGIIDLDGNWKVEPMYENIYRQLIGGFKTVSKKQISFKRYGNSKYETKYGYIDENFKTVLEPKFKELTILENGNFYVADSQAAIINAQLDTLYFHDGTSYYLGTAYVKIYDDSISKYAILDYNGNLVTDFEFNTISYTNNRVFYGNKETELIIFNKNLDEKASIKNGRMLRFDENYSVFSDNLKLYIYDDISEKIIREIPFANAKLVHLNNDEVYINQANNYSIYDLKSNKEQHLPYDGLSQPVDGLSVVEMTYTKGLMDLDGNEILPPVYNSIGSISEGIFFARKNSLDTTFAYNYQGEKLFSIENGIEYEQYYNDMLLVKKNNAYSYLDKNGVLAFNSLVPCGNFYNERAAFQDASGKIGFYDKSGNKVIEAKYSEFGNFNALGLAAVKDPTTNLWGFINQSGELKIPHQYEKIGDFKNGYAMVSKQGKLGQINSDGEEQLSIEYEELKEFSEGYFAARKDSLWGFVNEKGKVKIPFQYENVAVFKDGVCWVINKGKLELIDTKGTTKLTTDYSNTNNFQNGVSIVVDKNGKYGIIDKNGKFIIPLEKDYISQVDDNTFLIGYSENWSKIEL